MNRLLRSNLKFKHLQIIDSLNALRHVGKVAEAMHTTQPSISKALAEMEALLGIRLFERSTHGLEPTVHGEILIQFARETLAQLERVNESFQGLEQGMGGVVRVGSMMAASCLIVPKSAVLLKQASPTTTVKIEEGVIGALLEQLKLERLDLLINRLSAVNGIPGLELEELYDDGAVVVCGPNNDMAQQTLLDWRDVEDYPWVLTAPDTPPRRGFDLRWAAEGLLPPRDVVETTSFLAMLSMIRERNAFTVLAKSFAIYLQGMGLVSIPALPAVQESSPIGLVRIKGRKSSAAVELFCQCARRAAAGMQADLQASPMAL